MGIGAQTNNDIVAWVPDRSVLFSGDLVFVGGTPFVPMGSVSGSLVALERIRGFATKTLVPGHGPVSGPEAIDVVADYLRFIQETARAGKAARLSALDLARHTEPGRFAELTDSERIVGNLYRAYAELEGTAPGAPIDIRAALGDMVTFNGGPLRCLA